eukprot:9485899-Pyramimonas_sp.AAC.1
MARKPRQRSNRRAPRQRRARVAPSGRAGTDTCRDPNRYNPRADLKIIPAKGPIVCSCLQRVVVAASGGPRNARWGVP